MNLNLGLITILALSISACASKRAEPKLVEIEGIRPGISKYEVAVVETKTTKDDLKNFLPSLQSKSVQGLKSAKVFKNIKAENKAGGNLLVQLEMVNRDAASKLAHLSSLKAETAITVKATFTDLGSRKNLGQIEIVGTSAKVNDGKLKLVAVDNMTKLNDDLDELALASVARQLAEYVAARR